MLLTNALIKEFYIAFTQPILLNFGGLEYREFVCENKRTLKPLGEKIKEVTDIPEPLKALFEKAKERRTDLELLAWLGEKADAGDSAAAELIAINADAKKYLAQEVEVPLITMSRKKFPEDLPAYYYDLFCDTLLTK